jgi:hypothetical protein
MATPQPQPLYRRQELAYCTQYAELKERSQGQPALLPGTPGTLVLRDGTGYAYWYRRYYAAPGLAAEDIVCKDGDDAALQDMRDRIEFADWAMRQVRSLRLLGYQVADKDAAGALVGLRSLFDGGLVMVGTLAFMSWLNELGAVTVAPRTQGIDLARRARLELAAPVRFLDTVLATKLRFVSAPGMPAHQPSTSVKRPGKDGLRIDLLAHGPMLGDVVPVPELHWHAQTVPHYDYLLDAPRDGVVLAGGHCIAVKLPQPERFVWHKLYSSAARSGNPEKQRKDLQQAATLAAVLVEQDDAQLADAAAEAPHELMQAAKSRLPTLRTLLHRHPQALEQVELALASQHLGGSPGASRSTGGAT